jgi:ring-1,2-phenylacetyl-CoA epoxidase subunit PaaD
VVIVSSARAQDAWDALDDVMDPEVPVVSVVDLGIVREVEVAPDGSRVEVAITPTYSGCPAMLQIEQDIAAALQQQFAEVEVRTVLRPAWTTDWMSQRGRDRLREFGIAPPPGVAPAAGRIANALPMAGGNTTTECPRCGSDDVERIAEFGSTACKALWRCRSCLEPFDQFKPL